MPERCRFLTFYVDESVPFGESSRFACTGAPVLRGLGPSCFQQHRLISILPSREQPRGLEEGLGAAGVVGGGRSNRSAGGPRVYCVL